MFTVLVHPRAHHYNSILSLFASLSFSSRSLTPRSLAFFAAVFLCFYLCIDVVSAVTVINGQIFTDGLAIVDAPAPNSELHAGSQMNIAIDISGNGRLPQTQTTSGNTRFDSLEIYLISSFTSLNLTISQGTGLLTQEPGSTVKHLNWPIPSCVPSGTYDVTFYEASHVDGAPYYSISPLSVGILNTAPSGTCSSNNLQSQPQSSSPPPQNPWTGAAPEGGSVSAGSIPVPTSSSTDSISSVLRGAANTLIPNISQSGMITQTSETAAATNAPFMLTGAVTVTVGPGGVQWPLTVGQPSVSATIVIMPSSSTGPSVITMFDKSTETATATVTQIVDPSSTAGRGTVTVTVTPTITPTPVTVVFASVETLVSTTTAPGKTQVVTTTETSYSTTTAFMSVAPSDDPAYAGYLPINSASDTLCRISWTLLSSTILALLVFVL